MRFASFIASLSLLALGACATGGSIDPTGTGGSGGSGSAGGAGGAGGDPSTTSTGGSGGSAPTCSEQPCKLVAPQCGCSPGEQCSIDGAGDRACVGEGDVSEGQICDEGAACAPGLLCVGYTGFESSCARFCESDAQCESPGGKCVLTLGDVPDVLLCSEDCEPISSQGCAPAGLSCQIAVTETEQAYTQCAPSGTGVFQTLCVDNADCAPGFACFPTTNNDTRCFAWCSVASPNCGAQTCQGFDVPLVIGNVEYGVCT